jgi:hypothetical protein
MALTLKDVTTKKEYREFIYLPEKIHKGHDNWLPPLYMDEKTFFNPKKNYSFHVCDHRLILAYKDGKVVGRIMGIINHQHNKMMGLNNVRFAFIETYNDQEVAHALISEIENWGREKGMTKIIGPFGFSDREPQGLLIEGFEYEPVVDSACNFEYLPKLVENEGYTKELDCVIYRYPLTSQLPEVMERIYQRVRSRKDLQFHEYTKRKQLKPIIVPALKVMNEAFKDIYGFTPLDETEMMELARKYIPILDPQFVKVITKDNEVIAFLVSMPNMYKGIQKAKGRLFPFGIFHILKAMKTAKSINLMLGGILPAYQKQALDLAFTLTTIETARKMGMTSVDTHVVMEGNNDMMNEFKRYGGAFLLKKFRVYQKAL